MNKPKTLSHAALMEVIQKYSDGSSTPEEAQFVEAWYDNLKSSAVIPEDKEIEADLRVLDRRLDPLWLSVLKKQEDDHRSLRIKRPFVTVAAASIIIGLLTLGIALWLFNFDTESRHLSNIGTIHDIQPATNKATLQIGHEKIYQLSSEQRGIDVQNSSILYDDGTLINESLDAKDQSNKPNIHVLTTPKGGIYQITLPDGSKVWLNASSTLKYPSRFSNTERSVELEGEAYFEIQKSKTPFFVKSDKQQVRVLGTSFNMAVYPQEKTAKTTLIEGSVQVQFSVFGTVHMKPGQQLVYNVMQNEFETKNVDISESVAWKEGFFDFTEADIYTVMNEFSRWYDLEVIYDGPQTTETFTGRIPRTWSFNKVLLMMNTFKSTQIILKGRSVMVKQ